MLLSLIYLIIVMSLLLGLNLLADDVASPIKSAVKCAQLLGFQAQLSLHVGNALAMLMELLHC